MHMCGIYIIFELNNVTHDLDYEVILELVNYHNDMEKKIKRIKTQYDEFIKGEAKLPFDCVDEILICV